jgi:hypothetical protein
MFWATVATLGVSATLIAYSQFIIAVKIFGGLYLLWLAFKSGRNAFATATASVLNVERTPTLTSIYSRGVNAPSHQSQSHPRVGFNRCSIVERQWACSQCFSGGLCGHRMSGVR